MTTSPEFVDAACEYFAAHHAGVGANKPIRWQPSRYFVPMPYGAEKGLRHAVAWLVDAGHIKRVDSPNGRQRWYMLLDGYVLERGRRVLAEAEATNRSG